MIMKDHALQTFIALYEEEFGESISLDEAREMVTRVTDLMLLVSNPLPPEASARCEKDSGETHPHEFPSTP